MRSAPVVELVLADVPDGERPGAGGTVQLTGLVPAVDLSERRLLGNVGLDQELLPTIPEAITPAAADSETVWENFLQWIDVI